jgi:hypothetical protein
VAAFFLFERSMAVAIQAMGRQNTWSTGMGSSWNVAGVRVGNERAKGAYHSGEHEGCGGPGLFEELGMAVKVLALRLVHCRYIITAQHDKHRQIMEY